MVPSGIQHPREGFLLGLIPVSLADVTGSSEVIKALYQKIGHA
jgi:hypothetical protein